MLWTIIPTKIIFDYVKSESVKAEARALIKAGKVCHSYYYEGDRSLKRWINYQKNQFHYFSGEMPGAISATRACGTEPRRQRRDAMKTLGIIGGMGPMATAYLLELIIRMTDAKTDQEHLNIMVFNNPQVPDRTSYILDRTKPSPLPVLEGMAHSLETMGAQVLCAPCVTSHYFYQELSSSVSVPFLHMVETAQSFHRW